MNALVSHAVPGSALLDPVESALEARPLRSWRDAQKESVRQRFAALHRAWCAEWTPARNASLDEPEVHAGEPDGVPALASEDSVRWSFAASPRRGSLLNQNASLRDGRESSHAAIRAVADRMFAADATMTSASAQEPSKVATAVARAAWEDWLRRIDGLIPGTELKPQEAEGALATDLRPDPWSGALCVRWPWCGGVWTLVLSHEAVSNLLGTEAVPTAVPGAGPQRAPKERLDRVLTGQTVPLRIMLEGVELNLGQLQELRLDDVVPLEHALDAPAQVIGADGTPVCDGWLGQIDGRIAIELALPHIRRPVAAPAANTYSSKERKQ
jgi:hypothetical protein